MLFLVSLPFDLFYSHVILISLAVHTAIQYKKEYISPVFTWRNLVLVSVFLVTMLSTLYSINKPQAFNEWGKQSAILVMPLFFCFTTLNIKKYRANLLLAFSLLCTATVFYLYANALYTIRFYHLPVSELLREHFTNQNFSEPIQMHATFFSMQLAVALISLLPVLIKEKVLRYKLFYTFCVGILAAGLFQLGAKSVIGCVFILVITAVPALLISKAKRLKFVLVVCTIAIVPVVFVFRSASLRERYITALSGDLSHKVYNEGVEPRLVRWNAALTDLIAKKPVIGYGAGSEVQLLQDVFFNKKIYYAYLNKLNVHNEYLSFLIKSGIVGLIIYLATLWFGFKSAVKNRDLVMLAFMAIIACVSLSENLLDVDKGIMFYAFFFSFFLFSADENKSASNDNLLSFVATNQLVTSSSLYNALSPDAYKETVY
jgi:O-antigen ligase